MTNSKSIVTLGAILTFVGIALSLYLADHHYRLIFAFQDTSSVCNLGGKINCDAVNTSRFSEFLGIPVAMFGAFTFLAQFFLLVGIRFIGEDDRKPMSRYLFYISTLSLLVCLGFAFISLFLLKVYCLFCISMYVLFIFLFFISLKLVGGISLSHLPEDISALLGRNTKRQSYGVLAIYLLIPIGSALGHGMYSSSFVDDQKLLITRSINDWISNPQFNFNIENAPTEGTGDKFTIVEFADFQCGHCRRASHSLHAFVQANESRVKFIFQNYPLDSSCNPKVQGRFHDHACRLAKAAICGGQIQKFRPVHDWIFAHQEGISSNSIDEMIAELQLPKESFISCLESQETANILSAQIERANGAGVQGTPAVFVNGRNLPTGFVIPVLNKALEMTP